jgi:hypothetical protein
MSKEIMKANIKRIENEIRVTKERLDNVQKSLLTATPNNVDQLLESLTSNASKLGMLEIELDDEQKKLRALLGITKELSLTLPKEVWERINYELKYQPNSNEELMIRDIIIHSLFPTGLKE